MSLNRASPVILMRTSLAEEAEREVARRHFKVVENRGDLLGMNTIYPKEGEVLHLTVPAPPRLVIPRYSALPYYRELEYDVLALGGQLINPYRQHRYVADMQNWYYDLQEITPETWFRYENIPSSEEGAFVVKGATNSRKHQWKTRCFAPDRQHVIPTMLALLDDPFIAEQGLVFRKFEKFHSYGENDITGQPITDEWRYFICDGQILASGFYWSEHLEGPNSSGVYWINGCPVDLQAQQEARDQFVTEEVIPRVGDKIRFYVADIARVSSRIAGRPRYRVVELNDGQMSGLSCVDPEALYANLARALMEPHRDDAKLDKSTENPEGSEGELAQEEHRDDPGHDTDE